MASVDSTNGINDRAAEWAVETAFGDMSPESRSALEAWLAADRRHRGAFARARAWLRATEQAVIEAHSAPASSPSASSVPVSDNDNGEYPSSPAFGVSRLRLSGWGGRIAVGGGALAACVVAMVVVGVPALPPPARTRPSTPERVVSLKDGSTATLSRDGRIEVTLSDSIRKIMLLSGKATFEVAKDKARPFVVRSGDVYAQATGTIYSVARVGSSGGTVKVARGSVLVWLYDERDQAVLLHAGDTVTLDPGPRLQTASARPSPPPPELAQISLDDVSVKVAAVRFNRVNSTKIVIADPVIGETRIIGLYRANDPERFAQAVAAISGGRVAHRHGSIVIKMK